MRAEVLIPRATPTHAARRGLYTYAVPEALAALLNPGQLVAVPFGEQTVAGLVWALDASDDADEDATPARGEHRLREIESVLLDEALLLPAQRALAEWLADHYAAPLGSAARLLLPPGLLSEARTVLRLRGDAGAHTSKPTAAQDQEMAPPADEDVVLALLRERGWLERQQVEKTLGRARATAAISALIAQRRVSLTIELTERHTRIRHERIVRLAGEATQLEAWRRDARAQLDALPAIAPGKRLRKTAPADERLAERLLRQLAVLDVLNRASQDADGLPVPSAWKLEELQRLTRATQAALSELVAAGLIAMTEEEVRHDPLAGRRITRTRALPLTPAQGASLATILDEGETPNTPTANRPDARVYLLHGITGSGKTEVYLQALAAVIARGQRGIVLVPEIALTPQAMARFAGRFPGRVALLHSGLTDAERLDEWRRIRAGLVDVVLGSRSALFAPVDRLGLIVVDEEHEGAYKHERTPTYHARDVAVQLGRLTGAAVVLGSATPSIESYALAESGVYTLVELRERAPVRAADSAPAGERERQAAGLPPVTIVDLRAELRGGNTSILSERLRTALEETLERREQAILFLNRRGMASSVLCRECGYVAVCGHCDVSMTFHAAERKMICHYCGKKEPMPETCPICWSAGIRFFGLGTERVEAAVKRQFPAAGVLRWDRDTARTRQAHEDLLRAFAERRADVLVGTQMIAKGLDLPGVTLVGVVSADVALFLPDFRASERAFQLLTQVAGRAGRGETPGQVLVQTFNPDHFCIQAAARHDYAELYAAEVSARQRYGYPPFRRFVKCTYEHTDRYSAQIEATVLAERVQKLILELALPDTDIVGPAPAFMERLRGRYRWQLLIRSPDPRPLLRALTYDDLPRGWFVDVDPASSL